MKTRLIAAFVMMCVIVESDADPVLLKMKWMPGEKQITDINILQEQSSTIPGMPQPMKQTTKQTLRTQATVLPEKTDGQTVIELEFLSTSMESEMNGVKMTFDSSSEPASDGANPIAPIMRGMIESKFKYFMDGDGALKKITGIEEFIDKISQGNPMIKSMMSQMFSEDSMKNMSGGGMDGNYLPKGPVDVGAKWSDEQTMALGPLGETSVTMQYLFKGWEKKENISCVLITFTGSIKTVDDGTAPDAMMGMTIDKIDGTMNGKIWFDPEAGLIRSSEIKQVMKMVMSLPQQGDASGASQKLNSDINQTITNTLVEHRKK